MNCERLPELIDLSLAGAISADDHELLQRLLTEDPTARAAFRERMDLEAGLRTWALEDGRVSLASAANSKHSQHTGTRFFLGTPTTIAFGIAASILLVAGIQFAIVSNSKRKEVVEETGVDPTQVQTNADVVGVIRQQGDCEWDIRPVSFRGELTLGKLSLSKGIAELSFDSGTEITLDAPCKIEVTSGDKAILLAGNVFVNVTERSNGFTLGTPESQIIDEGTEYAVSVADESTEVHVFDGRVVWVPESSPGERQTEFKERIEAGQAKSYLRSEPTKSRFIPFGRRQFVRNIEQLVRESTGGSLVAYDGFENLAGRLRRGRSGFGWASGWQPVGQGRGPLANIVDSPIDVVFGLDRSGRRQISLTGSDIRRAFENPIALTSGDDIYLSVLLSRESPKGESESDSLRISLEPDLPGRGRQLHQVVSFGFAFNGVPFVGSRNTISKGTPLVASDQTYLCVLKMIISDDGTTSSLRIYLPGERVEESEPSSWTVGGVEGSIEHAPASIRITASESTTWQVDELKIGTTWPAVVSTAHSI